MDCYPLLNVLPCCWSRSAVVGFDDSVEADAGRDIAVGNCGVGKSSEYLVLPCPRGTCHKASSSKGICGEIPVLVIARLEGFE
jgi:hypothetical protein